MSIVQRVHEALQQEGYRPQQAEDGSLTFGYFGQQGRFRTHSVGEVVLAELECTLPRPEPEASAAQWFLASRPLCRLGGHEGHALLKLETMLMEHEVSMQVRLLLRLLDQYSADFVWNQTDMVAESGQGRGEAVQTPTPSGMEPTMIAQQPGEPDPVPVSVSPTGLAAAPAGWEDAWGLLNARYHPLALALARLGVPAPREVQMDMVQGQQVKGTAILLWGAPPEAVVVCEQGQLIPAGYQGATWYQHQTVEQVAAETLAYLKLARLA